MKLVRAAVRPFIPVMVAATKSAIRLIRPSKSAFRFALFKALTRTVSALVVTLAFVLFITPPAPSGPQYWRWLLIPILAWAYALTEFYFSLQEGRLRQERKAMRWR